MEAKIVALKEKKEFGFMRIRWDSEIGFGQFDFLVYPDGRVWIDSECMNKEFVKQVLSVIIDDADLRD